MEHEETALMVVLERKPDNRLKNKPVYNASRYADIIRQINDSFLIGAWNF